jgi:hypothetical protein
MISIDVSKMADHIVGSGLDLSDMSCDWSSYFMEAIEELYGAEGAVWEHIKKHHGGKEWKNAT